MTVIIIPIDTNQEQLTLSNTDSLYNTWKNSTAIYPDVFIATASNQIASYCDSIHANSILSEELKNLKDISFSVKTAKLLDVKSILSLPIDFSIPKNIKDIVRNIESIDVPAIGCLYRFTNNEHGKIKVVTNKLDHALYCSKTLIPHNSNIFKILLDVYILNNQMLEIYETLSDSVNKTENIELLKIIEAGYTVQMSQLI
jgi:CMP-2-keto-3-deoxyoctulosonic acid synthetase